MVMENGNLIRDSLFDIRESSAYPTSQDSEGISDEDS